MKKLYIRFGEPCPDGISRKYGFNGEPIAKENGLSCYDAIPAKTSDEKEGWKPVGRSKKSERLMDPTIKIYRKPELLLLSRKGKERKKVVLLISGREIGTDSDGEPSLDPKTFKVEAELRFAEGRIFVKSD